MRMKKLLASMGMIACLQSAVWAAPTGYTVSDENQHLYRIDLETGLADDLGYVGTDAELEGLATDGTNLFGVSEANFGLSLGIVWNLSPLLRGEGEGFPEGVPRRREGSESGAAFINGTLFNIQSDDQSTDPTRRSWLYSINTNTGQPTWIGASDVYVDGLAYDSNRAIAYASSLRLDKGLFTVDLSNGALSKVLDLGFIMGETDTGLAFDAAGDTIYLLSEDGFIYTINPNNFEDVSFRAVVIDRATGDFVPADLEGFEIVPEGAGLKSSIARK